MKDELKIAKRLLEVLPSSMARIRNEMRSCIPRELSVADFRILGSIVRGKTLVSDIAKYHGVSQPSMSRSVEGLVKSGFIERSRESSDRRRSPLKLTSRGTALFYKITEATEYSLSKQISALDYESREVLLHGLIQLEKLFFPEHSIASQAIEKGKT